MANKCYNRLLLGKGLSVRSYYASVPDLWKGFKNFLLFRCFRKIDITSPKLNYNNYN